MADQKLNLVINGKNNAGPAVKDLKQGILGAKAAAVALVAAFAGLTVLMIKAVKAANVQELAEAKLAQSLKAAGDFSDKAFQSLLKLASAQQKVTVFGDEATIAALAQFKAYSGLSNEMMGKMIPAIQDFASAQQIGLKTAFELVGKSIGSSTNALARYGIEIDVTAGKTDKANQLIEGLGDRFGGAAQAEAETFSGNIKQLSNNLGDLLESIGQVIISSPELVKVIKKISGALAGLAEFLGGTEEAFDAVAKAEKTLEFQEKLLDKFRTLYASKEEERFKRIIKRQEEIVKKTKERIDKLKKLEKPPEDIVESIDKEIKAIENRIEALLDEVAVLKEKDKLTKEEEGRIEKLEAKRTELTTKRLAQAESIITFEEALRKGSDDKEEESLEERIKRRRDAHEQMNEDALTLFDALEEQTRITAEFTAAVVAASLDAVGSAFTVFFNVMFTRNKDFAAQMKDVWRGLVNTILTMIGQLIARMLALKILTSLFPGGEIIGTGFKQLFGKSLMGMFGLQGFQTPHGTDRVIPGPPNMQVPFMGHGGERVGRGNGGGFTLVVNGDFLSTEETNAKIFQYQHDYKKRNNLE